MRLHLHPVVLYLFTLALDTGYIDILHSKIRVVLVLYVFQFTFLQLSFRKCQSFEEMLWLTTKSIKTMGATQ